MAKSFPTYLMNRKHLVEKPEVFVLEFFTILIGLSLNFHPLFHSFKLVCDALQYV